MSVLRSSALNQRLFWSVTILGHSNAQQAIAPSFSNDLRSVTLLRLRTTQPRSKISARFCELPLTRFFISFPSALAEQ